MQFEPHVNPPDDTDHDHAHWIIVRSGHVVIEAGAGSLPFGSEPPASATGPHHFLGLLDGRPVWAVDLPDEDEPHDWHELVHLRSLYTRVPEPEWMLAGRAEQIIQWDRTHRYCGRCGSETELHQNDRARQCPACGFLAYPRLAPAVIVLVERDDGKILLAHGRQFPGRFFSTLAGFVEPGEGLETCVEREIKEEVGIDVTDITYFGSQPWPFPHSLMIGFNARYAGGELEIQEEEIVEAGWFGPDELPPCPRGAMSIAGRLIDHWLAN
ncbi:MAG: NAD(+) diphosphatase [Actinomycetia bacterium]|nr:NAD(+) diphosphatase [Actinomycetes bacterium]MCP4958469.1 NAD(+) diphosphatase [Actinomycetes bacterium]